MHLRSIRINLGVGRGEGALGSKGFAGEMLYDDVVVLIPGFFGFGRLGDFFYFADRVGATLRGAIEARLGRAVPVLSIAAEPMSSLASRQRLLLEHLRRFDSLLEGPARYPLVGHSAGGVDADLLRMAEPLTRGLRCPDCDSHGIRFRVRSIIRGERRPSNDAFFRSGAAFGDDQFFELYERVAKCLARAAHAGEQAARRLPVWGLASNQ